jgi:hypothetical protein
MAIAAPTLSSSKYSLKEYNSLFTEGRLTKLSATRPFTDALFSVPGIGYPWFLLDPTYDGFTTAKSYYLSSANRQVSGYPETVQPNNIQEAYGKCVPWSNLTLGASAQYISQSFIDNTRNQPFWFYVVPPSGNPIPVVIHYPKYSNESPKKLTPINEWYVSPAGIELSRPKLTFWTTTTGVAIELQTPYSNKTIRQDTTNPLVTSFVWIESFLAYVSMTQMSSGQRINGSKPKFNIYANTVGAVSSNLVGYANPTTVLVPSDVYELDAFLQTKPDQESYSKQGYLTQLHKVLSSSGIFNKTLPTGETAQQFLSAFYSYKPYPKTADIRTMFDLLTGTKYRWHMPISHAGVYRGPADIVVGNHGAFLTKVPTSRQSLIQGVPTRTFADKTSAWSAVDVAYAKSKHFRRSYTTVINKYLSHWRTLSSLPVSALQMFNFDPSVNTVVVTKQPVAVDFRRVGSWTMYHPELSTWVVYTSAPGLEHFTKTGRLTSTNFVTTSSFKNVILSAISLNINTPDNYKIVNTGTKFGKYETYIDKAPVTTISVTDLTATGRIPLTALDIQNVTFVTDYIAQTIHSDRVLSGTIFIWASGSFVASQMPSLTSQYKTKYNARVVIPPTRFAVRTPIVAMSGSAIQTTNRYLPAFNVFTLGTLPATGTYVRTAPLTSQNAPNITYATGQIPANVLRTSQIYRNLAIVFSGPTNNDRIRTILGDKTTYPVVNHIAHTKVNEELVPVLDMRRGIGAYEVITINPPQSIGISQYNHFGQTYSAGFQMHVGSTARAPYNYQPTIIYSEPVIQVSNVGKLHWPTTVYRRRPRPVRAEFSVQRRKTVLGY